MAFRTTNRLDNHMQTRGPLTPGVGPAATTPTTPATPAAPGFPTTPRTGAGVTPMTPGAGVGVAATNPNGFVRTAGGEAARVGGPGLGRGGRGDKPQGYYMQQAMNAGDQGMFDRDMALFDQYYKGGNHDAAAAILNASGQGRSNSRMQNAIVDRYFGGDVGGYKAWGQPLWQGGGHHRFDLASGSLYDASGNLVSGSGAAPHASQVLAQQQGGAPGQPQQGGGTPLGQLAQAPNGAVGAGTPGMGSPGYGVGVEQFLDPSMQFRMNEGMRALENSAAGRGSLMSGDTLRGITDYAQGLAGTEYGNAFNRATNARDFQYGMDRADQLFDYQVAQGDRAYDYQRLRDLASFGLQAAGQEAQSGNVLSGLLASIMQNGGQIQGTGTMGAGNQITGGIGNIMNWLMQQQMLNRIPT